MRLRTKFSLGIVSLIALAIFSVSAITIYSERKLLKEEISQNHEMLVKRLAQMCEESLYQNDLVFFNYLKSLKDERGFHAAAFLDANGLTRIHSNPELIDKSLESPKEAMAQKSTQLFNQQYTNAVGLSLLDFSMPVYFKGNQVGTARLLISDKEINDFLNQSLISNVRRIGFISLFVLFIAIFASFAFAHAMTTPIHNMVKAMRKISKGQLETIEASNRKDEIGLMERELNIMSKKLDELEKMKRDFVAGVQHDLKSPIKAIQGFAAMISDDLEKGAQNIKRDHLLIIQNNANRVIKLIDELLTAARIEAGREEPDFEAFDIRRTIKEISNLYIPLSKQNNIDLNVKLPNQDTDVWADKQHVTLILTNLLSNAFKFTKQGSIGIEVADKPQAISVQVSDTGSGIPGREADKIFDKFYRSKSNAHQAKGTGLGLSIVKGLVEGMSGKIEVKSQPQKGTTFSILLPKPPVN